MSEKQYKRFDKLDEYRQMDLDNLRDSILKELYNLAGDMNESPLIYSHKIMKLIRDSEIMDECYEGSYDAFKASQDD